eukprot:SM000318S12222  [mRNA]  locus=s318:80095:81161:+ [translate_table: standard]
MTANGSVRRKHHTPWTLREVMTLVEGVARCGPGKWADIKKLAFSSTDYRTAVDLKACTNFTCLQWSPASPLDKWRNLLRASCPAGQTAKLGERRKKNLSASVPAQVLARVRELADRQLVPANSSGSSGAGTSADARGTEDGEGHSGRDVDADAAEGGDGRGNGGGGGGTAGDTTSHPLLEPMDARHPLSPAAGVGRSVSRR